MPTHLERVEDCHNVGALVGDDLLGLGVHKQRRGAAPRVARAGPVIHFPEKKKESRHPLRLNVAVVVSGCGCGS